MTFYRLLLKRPWLVPAFFAVWLGMWWGLFYYPVPIVGRGLTSNANIADIEFDQRVRERYGHLSDHLILGAQLVADGFSKPYRRGEKWIASANDKHRFTCGVRLNVEWSENNGSVRDLEGVRTVSCVGDPPTRS